MKDFFFFLGVPIHFVCVWRRKKGAHVVYKQKLHGSSYISADFGALNTYREAGFGLTLLQVVVNVMSQVWEVCSALNVIHVSACSSLFSRQGAALIHNLIAADEAKSKLFNESTFREIVCFPPTPPYPLLF